MNVRSAILLAVQCIALPACSSFDEGITLDVVLQGSSEAQTKTVTSDLGYEVTITRAYVAVGGVEIIPCVGDDAVSFDFGALFRVGRAYAHTETTPTRVGIPGVLPLGTGRNVQLLLGTIAPPQGRYCGVRVTGSPADADAIALPSDVPFVGKVLHLEGTYRRDGGSAVAFTIASGLTFELECTVPPITLGEHDTRHATLTVTIGDRLVDGIDFAAMTSEDMGRAVLRNVQADALLMAQ